MFCDQFGFADLSIALVAAVHGAAVRKEMFGSCGNMGGVQRRTRDQIALQAYGHRTGIGRNQPRIRGIAFICSAPAQILRDSKRWRKGPFNPAA
jgi:hypothetical protein